MDACAQTRARREPSLSTILEHPDGRVELSDGRDGLTRIVVPANERSTFSGATGCDTSYPRELIELVLRAKGPSHLCDEIRRDEDPDYVRAILELGTLAYSPAEWFAGKRMLDFGCGSGASTVILSRLFPESEIVGIDMEGDLLELARARARHYGMAKLSFLASPGPEELPRDLGHFDAVFFNALYEHLLPSERDLLLPVIWKLLLPGGLLFLTETPNRAFPIERHTTGLPLLNYLPRSVVLAIARRHSDRVARNESWESLLRRGIRGGRVGTILRQLGRGAAGRPELLAPAELACADRIDLWLLLSQRMSGGGPPGAKKRILAAGLKLLKRLSGVELLPELSLAIRKS